MPRTGKIRRFPDPVSRQNSSSFPVHQHQSNVKVNGKISHRFVRIHHKTRTPPSVPSPTRNQEQATQVVVSQTRANPSDTKHEVFVAKNTHSTGGEVTAVPDPIPDTGFRPLPIPLPLYTHVPGPTARPSQLVHSVPLSETALPMLSLQGPHSTALGHTASPSFPTFLPVATAYENGSSVGSAAEVHPTNATGQSRKLSIPLIVLLAVGCALAFIGIFSLVKYYSRPTRRPRPRPSLPVLDDPFADDKELPPEDSPIFGGKERLSNGIWSWSHYSQPGIIITKPPSIAQPPAGGKSRGLDSVTCSPSLQGRSSNFGSNWRTTQSGYSSHAHTQSVPTVTSGNSPFHASLQQLQGALSRTATRVSAASASLYSSSPRNHSNVGLAITESPMTTFTADGSSVLKRTEPKAALDRSRNNSVEEAARDPISANLRNSEGSSYTTEISSPSFLPYTAPQRETSAKNTGRSKIKSSYYNVNSYPRISNPAGASTTKNQGSASESLPSLRKSDARRDRDTQALTHALGLSSPASAYVPPSPQPTLYPDDSLSVVEAKRPRKPQASSHKKQIPEKVKEGDRRPSLPVISTAMDASAALGSLMLMDFAGNTTRLDDSSTKRLSVTSLHKATSGGTGAGAGTSAKSVQGLSVTKTPTSAKRNSLKSTDKPPSIPLPELLPSLEQMGLEHANPQAYADYRSPTYSIYGLYGGDRKSGAGY